MDIPDFIAEVSSNHNQNLDRMRKFISVAEEIGCAGVKFQLFKIDDLFSKEIIKNNENVKSRRKWELNEKYIPELSRFARSKGLKFGCTPFYLEAVDFLKPYVDFWKISSYEILWLKLFEKCSQTGLPIVFSTGIANISEIEDAVFQIKKGLTKDITILHCNSTYPTPINEVNLRVLVSLRKHFKNNNNISIGWSDHSSLPSVIYRSVFKFNAKMVEFHLDLDGKGNEYKSGHCWLPEEIKNVINTIREGYIADGDNKIQPSLSELSERDWRADPQDGLRPMKNIRVSIE